MMGKKAREFATHSAVSVEAPVPTGHFYRHLEKTLDLTFVPNLFDTPLPEWRPR